MLGAWPNLKLARYPFARQAALAIIVWGCGGSDGPRPGVHKQDAAAAGASGGAAGAAGESAVADAGKSAPDAGAISASCSEWAYHLRDQCPEKADILGSVDDCERLRRAYEPVGCAEPYARIVQCRTESKIDCVTGADQGCPDSETYGQCVSQFVQRTGCTHEVDRDPQCGMGTYYFLCIATVPAGCTTVGKSNLGQKVCCPSFAPKDPRYFREPMVTAGDE